MQNFRQTFAAYLYLLPALIIMTLVGVIPIAVVIFFSLNDTFGGNVFVWVGLQWFEQVLGSDPFYSALLRSLSFSFIVLSIQIPLGIYIAVKMPRSGVLAIFYIVLLAIPLLTPQIVVGYLWKVMVLPQTGLISQAISTVGLTLDMNSRFWTWAVLLLMDTWHWTGLVILLCYARLRTIPEAYFQAAAIDGAGRWAMFRHIQLPRLKLVLSIAVLLRFMDSFTIYTEAYVVSKGGPGLSTTFLSHELVQTGLIQFDLGEAGAMAVIYFFIVLLVSAVFYRLIVPPPKAERRI